MWSLCYRVRENTVFEVNLCLIFTGKYAAKLFKARLPSDLFKIMSEQSNKCVFSSDCYNHGLLLPKGTHLNQLSFCCECTWPLTVGQWVESQNHKSWKRPLRSSSATTNPVLPGPPLNPVPKHHIYEIARAFPRHWETYFCLGQCMHVALWIQRAPVMC